MSCEQDIQYKISGSSLSILFYECAKNHADQVGFLIGEKDIKLVRTNCDLEEISTEKKITTINIIAPLAVGSPYEFCDNVGSVNRTKLREILGEFEEEVVGWYMYRCNSRSCPPSMRDTVIHKQLGLALPYLAPHLLTYAAISTLSNSSGSTHSYKYTFYNQPARRLEPVSVSITNLGQPIDESYRSLSHDTRLPMSDVLSSIHVNSVRGDNVEMMLAVQKTLQDRIKTIVDNVIEGEVKLSRLIARQKHYS